MIDNYNDFEAMFDRAIAIAALKSHIWERHYLPEDLEYIRHDGECITVIGEDNCGEMVIEDFPVRYLSLGDRQITALEEAKYKAMLHTVKTVKRADIGVYIGLRNVQG